mgnify:CR=1 FL=1
MPFKKSTISAIIILVSLVTVIGLSGLNSLFQNKQNRVNDNVQSYTNSETTSSQFQPVPMEKISLTTNDNIKIAANLYGVENPVGWLILVHMMPSTKESYADLAERLQNLGYESLSIDLRGHGESDEGPNGYFNFSDSQHQKSIFDLGATVDYLMKTREARPDKIVFIGASFGANLLLQYISEHAEFKTAVLLSAGLNYRGVKTEPLVKNLKIGQKVFFISSRDDDDNSQENSELYQLLPDEVKKDSEIKIYDSGGHGTDMLENQPDLIGLIVEFIK